MPITWQTCSSSQPGTRRQFPNNTKKHSNINISNEKPVGIIGLSFSIPQHDKTRSESFEFLVFKDGDDPWKRNLLILVWQCAGLEKPLSHGPKRHSLSWLRMALRPLSNSLWRVSFLSARMMK